MKELSGVYADCCLGSHAPAPGAVLTFSADEAAAVGADADLDAAAGAAESCSFIAEYMRDLSHSITICCLSLSLVNVTSL